MPYEEHLRESAGVNGRCAVVTLSDSRTVDTDKSGRRIQELLVQQGHSVQRYALIPDDPQRLSALLTELTQDPQIEVILTNGGTGICRRDLTIAVVDKFIESPLPGFGELFRMLSFQQIGSGAMLSRAAGGIGSGKILFAMPGSTGAVELAMTKLILPELRHLLHELQK